MSFVCFVLFNESPLNDKYFAVNFTKICPERSKFESRTTLITNHNAHTRQRRTITLTHPHTIALFILLLTSTVPFNTSVFTRESSTLSIILNASLTDSLSLNIFQGKKQRLKVCNDGLDPVMYLIPSSLRVDG